MREVLEVIWGVRKQKYFCKWDSTAVSTKGPTGKSPDGVDGLFGMIFDRGERIDDTR
jgi:hypothetical protein